MKMDSGSRIVLACAGAAAFIFWLVLPVYSFCIVIPLFNLNGLRLAMTFNQIMIIFLLVPILMALIPLSGEKKYCIGAGALGLIACLVALLAKKPIIVGGNIKWLFQSAGALISGLGSALGQTITESNFSSYIDVACDNFLIGGLGLWINLIISFAYLIYAGVFAKEGNENAGSSGTPRRDIPQNPTRTPSGSSVSTTPTRTSHRT